MYQENKKKKYEIWKTAKTHNDTDDETWPDKTHMSTENYYATKQITKPHKWRDRTRLEPQQRCASPAVA